MSQNDRKRRVDLEPLETRNLMTLIGANPTLFVANGPNVHHYRNGSVALLQPANVQVYGTAQPGNASTTVTVGIFGEDRFGNIVNNGQPLGVVTPDILGQYHATISLPSNIRKDVNFLIAREEATSTQVSQLRINGTTISGLSGSLNIDAGTLSGLNGVISTPSLGITTSGSVTNPGTTSTVGGSVTGTGVTSTLTGAASLPAISITGLTGVATSPATAPITGSISTPASSSTLGGSITTPGSTSTLASTGVLDPGTSTFAQAGTAAESARTGTFSNGTGIIAPTTGTSTFFADEVAVSAPVTVYIHQPKGFGAIGPITPTVHVGGSPAGPFASPVVSSKVVHASTAHAAAIAAQNARAQARAAAVVAYQSKQATHHTK
jgi:hypothetical protein